MLREIEICFRLSEDYGMNLPQLQAFPKDRVRALFGLEPAALSPLLATMLPELVARRLAEQAAKPGRKRGPGGGRRRKLFPYQEVLLTLVYLRHNVSHAVVGQMFSVSADISENSFHDVVQLLRDLCPAHRFDAEKKWTRKEPSWHPDTLDVVLVDSFETPVAEGPRHPHRAVRPPHPHGAAVPRTLGRGQSWKLRRLSRWEAQLWEQDGLPTKTPAWASWNASCGSKTPCAVSSIRPLGCSAGTSPRFRATTPAAPSSPPAA